eukprot:gb/GECG01006293.1/.p1 GENE.gb/GECG01006293.1/~~gb/GECG01006293.1/.p1  ORF type:complete len:137 (+),score=13.11 gb/GECG01006293.1/:1-411(+)
MYTAKTVQNQVQEAYFGMLHNRCHVVEAVRNELVVPSDYRLIANVEVFYAAVGRFYSHGSLVQELLSSNGLVECRLGASGCSEQERRYCCSESILCLALSHYCSSSIEFKEGNALLSQIFLEKNGKQWNSRFLLDS